ncbi:MAG TPA: PP2C family protein-serine/threonine phosphatase [Edaphobacter sp.]|jgi:serine phosphatase RsbU (regulator of sigma subunit)|nr:PP2C family protein-serine/threonine phosphatase [Edaphobacter sp.]
MNFWNEDSAMFRRALLESERRRIYGVAAFLLIFAAAVVIRGMLFGAKHINPWGGVFLLTMAGYELWVLYKLKLALETGTNLPRAHWVWSILLEMAVPSLGMVYFSTTQLGDFRPVASSWPLAFFPLILLSVLRLNPWVSRMAGIVAMAGYLVAACYVGWRPILENPGEHSVAQTAVLFYAAVIVVSGFIAGMVSGEIRKHVEAALREAETQRQLKQIEHELGIARSIQQSLLPKIQPTIDGLEVSGWNLPADATGGDYFDWMRLRDGRVVVTLADVTGHGIGPALLASVCRAYARSSFDVHDDLVKALQHVNHFFGADLTVGRFATFAAAVCSGEKGTVELLSAGHGPIFVYLSATDRFDEYGAQAIPLGLMPELNSSAPVILEMKPGDMLVLATDGFFEWENAESEQFGVERLTQVVREARELPPDQIIAELYNAVKAFASGTKQVDDLTAVVIKRVANEASSAAVM